MENEIKTEHLTISINEITYDDMPNEFLQEVYELNGKEVAVSLMLHQPGVNVFIPARPFMKLEKRLLVKEFDGTTASLRRIARKYAVSERTIRQLLKNTPVKNAIPEEGQMSMFDTEDV